MLPAGAKKAQGPEIRLATEDDAAAIAEVLVAAFSPNREHYTPEAFAAVTPTPEAVVERFAEGPMWVAELDGEVVGTVSLTTEPEGLYVRSMAIKPSAQRLGIGKRLLDVIDDHWAASGHERIFYIRATSFPARRSSTRSKVTSGSATPQPKNGTERSDSRWIRR